jgi:hypothetical protein
MSALGHWRPSPAGRRSYHVRYAPKVTFGHQNAIGRKWDGPAALPPPTALRVRRGAFVRRRSITMPRISMVHVVTAIGIDMGKNTLDMVGLDSRGGGAVHGITSGLVHCKKWGLLDVTKCRFFKRRSICDY